MLLSWHGDVLHTIRRAPLNSPSTCLVREAGRRLPQCQPTCLHSGDNLASTWVPICPSAQRHNPPLSLLLGLWGPRCLCACGAAAFVALSSQRLAGPLGSLPRLDHELLALGTHHEHADLHQVQDLGQRERWQCQRRPRGLGVTRLHFRAVALRVLGCAPDA